MGYMATSAGVHTGRQRIIAVKRSAGVASDLNLRERVTRTPPPSAKRLSPLAFKPRGDFTRSPTEVSVALTKFF